MKRLAIYLTVAAMVALPGCGSSKTSTSTATTGAPVATASQCATAQLAASLGQSNGAAGTIYYPLNLRDTSSSTCTIEGYAAVSFVAGADNTGRPSGQAGSRLHCDRHALRRGHYRTNRPHPRTGG